MRMNDGEVLGKEVKHAGGSLEVIMNERLLRGKFED